MADPLHKTVNRAAGPQPAPAAQVVRSPLTRGRAQRQDGKPVVALQSPYAARFRDALPKFGKPNKPTAAQAKKEDEVPPVVDQAPAKEAAVGKPLARAPATPSQDPLFQSVKSQVRMESKRQGKHPLASRKRKEAENASALPEGDQADQSSKEKSTEEMERAGSKQQDEGKRFSADKFKEDLMGRINAVRPKNEGDAKALAKEPPVKNFEKEFSTKVAQQQGEVTGPLAEKAVDKPTGGKAEKPIVKVPRPALPPAPKPVDPKLAAPKAKADWEISRQRESEQLDRAMRDNRLSEEQLANSQEPSFIETLKVKQEAQKKAAEAPGIYRQKESALLQGAETRANESLSAGLQGMGNIQRKTGSHVFGGQGKTETETEKRQREIKTTIDGIYEGTVKAVKRILEDMASQVKEAFAASLKEKTESFNKEVARRISDYYGDWRIDDDLFGPDDVVVLDDDKTDKTRPMTFEEKFTLAKNKRINPDVYRIFVQEKGKFLQAMNAALDIIANNVQAGLTAAHNRIQLGMLAVSWFKGTLQGDELKFAEQLEQEVQMKFQNLEASVDDTREDLLQTLADQYTESVQQLEKTFNEINDELKKGWLERAAEFIKTVGKTIFQLADLLLTILVRMAHLIWDIIKHPIRFFETLVAGLKQGIGDFIGSIGTYMQEAFWSWITKATPAKNIRLSASSGVEGLFDLVVQVLNLGPADLRASVEKVLGKEFMQMIDKAMALGEKAMAFGEKALEPVAILFSKGPGALWEFIKDQLGGIVRSSFDRIRESVFNTFIEKALKWIAGFFIPGGGFVKIVKAIFRAFQFVAENLERIRLFFDSVFDSMEAATQGRTEGVASKIITGLKTGIVLALDFLAKQLDLDKIVGAVHKIIQSIRRPIVSAIEWVLGKVKPFVMKVIAKGKDLVAKALGGDPNAPPEQRLKNGLREGTQAVNRLSGGRIGITFINPVLAAVRLRHNMRRLEAQPRGTRWAVVGEVNPTAEELTEKLVDSGTTMKDGFASSITYAPVNDLGFGTKMTADPVGPGHPKGTTVSQTLRLELREDKGTREGLGSIAHRQGRYRLGHLLNHHIGGPGNDWRNLTPITPSANTTHLADVERNVKALVIDHKRWVKYEVVVSYRGEAPTRPAGSKVNILETQFARRLLWSYQLKKPGKNPNQLVNDDDKVKSIPTSDSGKVESISAGYPD